MGELVLRKDAVRNRERLLTAGRELFARRGFDATLNDVAHLAGVGVGTAYRRFANKEELIDAILVQHVDELEAILNEALNQSDPWEGLVLYLERSLAVQTKDRGLTQILSGHVRTEQYDWQRDRLAPLVDRVAERAREGGALREDVTGTDLILLQVAFTAVAVTAQNGPEIEERKDASELYRRYLWIALDGMRSAPNGITPLPVPPLTTSQAHTLLRTGAPAQ